MANINITNVCNRKCPYCFAEEFTLCAAKEFMTFENFKKAVDFVASVKGERVGILGGEPTLHPEFELFMEYVLNHPGVSQVTLFTNGSHPEYIKRYLSSPKFGCLVNCNSPKDLGDTDYQSLVDGLKDVFSDGIYSKNVNVGLNVYSPEIDYSFIVDICKLIKRDSLRLALAIPMNAYENEYDPLRMFYYAKPTLLSLFEKLLDAGVMPHFDCNLVSPCVWSAEETNFIRKFQELPSAAAHGFNLLTGNTCCPVIDISPDLTAVRCFGMSRDHKVNITDFNNVNDLRAYFSTLTDSYKFAVSTHENCDKCNSRMMQKCTCGCLAFKSKKIIKMRSCLNALC
jgi:hypothetical protein